MTDDRRTAHAEHVDAVVVGSGFGGSVSAYRLAEAGLSVVLLERGQPYAPGDFPRTPAEMGRAFWDPSAGLYGMFDIWQFRGCDSVVSSGLGGGSLIYANVLLRKDERWFVHEESLPDGGYEAWPVSRAELDPHYDVVERMLGATTYPLDQPAYARAAKTHALQDAAAELGLDWQLAPLAVSFAPHQDSEPALGMPIIEPKYGNLHGVERRTCMLRSECNIGCNEGAKNSLDHTYLSAAKHHGADLRPNHEVRAIRPRPQGGYEVDYLVHDPTQDHEDRSSELRIRTISCDRLVLAAGTYGTSYLLLRNRKHFPGLGEALGTRFSGNGDLLTFLLKAKDRNRIRPLDASDGPVITSTIRLPDEVDGAGFGLRGAYIQDGGYPKFVDWMVEGADIGHQISRIVHFMLERFRDFVTHAPDTNLSAEISELIGDGALSVSSLPLLGMGRDVPDGILRLRDDWLDVVWSTATSEAHFERLRKTMQRIGDVLGADFADNPIGFRKRIITVHPLGGAPMGNHPGEGVCDPYGEVYGHPGLYIADGAALPGPVGANPSLTIAALADRMSTRLLDLRSTGTTGVTAAKDAPASAAGDDTACESAADGGSAPQGNAAADRTSLSFTEEMKGFYADGVISPRTGDVNGRRLGQRFTFQLTITVDDVNRFLDEPEHTARAEGWIEAGGCGGRCLVQRGWFNLFTAGDAPDRRQMKYRLYFVDGTNQPRTLVGWKNIWHGPLTRIWLDTSTLYFRLLEGHVPEGEDDEAEIVGAGMLHIRLADFTKQLTTFRTSGPHGLAATEDFGRFFVGQLWEVYRPE